MHYALLCNPWQGRRYTLLCSWPETHIGSMDCLSSVSLSLQIYAQTFLSLLLNISFSLLHSFMSSKCNTSSSSFPEVMSSFRRKKDSFYMYAIEKRKYSFRRDSNLDLIPMDYEAHSLPLSYLTYEWA